MTPLRTVATALAPIMTAAGLGVIVGAVFIADCRLNKGNTLEGCWLTGLPIMGLSGGAAGGAAMGFRAGYNTYNPNLRRSTSGATQRTEES